MNKLYVSFVAAAMGALVGGVSLLINSEDRLQKDYPSLSRNDATSLKNKISAQTGMLVAMGAVFIGGSHTRRKNPNDANKNPQP